ncbi:hypothetical protein O181_026879 [Austropuccinia psidii MF-1]|uniref:FAD dependent oxidoreductase domain-containing protein n=1 Tax=Austropuccinia psidii MF-1 TaxID=1389203 RepID=A0A9Q3H220_9BASI|nr:hypothetical protein [Austropuccinia psidii MF-1]
MAPSMTSHVPSGTTQPKLRGAEPSRSMPSIKYADDALPGLGSFTLKRRSNGLRPQQTSLPNQHHRRWRPRANLCFGADLLGHQQAQVDFASPWAGAYWNPFVAKLQTNQQQREAEWEIASFKELWKISDQLPSTVMKIVYQHYSQHKLSKEDLPWHLDFCPQARRLNSTELASAPPNTIDGFTFETLSLNPVLYLSYLRNKLLHHNVQFVNHRLKSVSEAFVADAEKRWPEAKIVINASGLGSRTLEGVEDQLVEPIRGQMVLIQPPKPLRFATSNRQKESYIICRPSTQDDAEEVVLGGCYQVGSYDLNVDHTLAQNIMEKAVKLRPDLSFDGTVKGLKVLRHIVALRPSRKSGARLEAEKIFIQGKDKVANLIHCYGIGPAGFQSSYGMAQEVKTLVECFVD